MGNLVRNARFIGHSDSETVADKALEPIASLAARRIGIECWSGLPDGLGQALRAGVKGADWVDFSGEIDEIRLVKSDAELVHIRAAARISDAMTAAAIDAVAVGVSEHHIAARACGAMLEAGSAYPGFGPFIRPGSRLGEEHTTWGDGSIADGDTVFIELSGCRHRYHAPMGRLVHVGAVPQSARNMAAVCQEAFAAVVAALRPGVLARDVYGAWQGVVDQSACLTAARMQPTGGAPAGQQLQRGGAGAGQFARRQFARVGKAAQQAGVAPGCAAAFAVDEHMLRVVQHAAAPVQPQALVQGGGVRLRRKARLRRGAGARLKPHAGLGFGQVFAECAFGQQRACECACQCRAGKVLQAGGNRGRLRQRRLGRVAVQPGGVPVPVFVAAVLGHAQQQLLRKPGACGRAKAYRVGDALAAEGYAVVRVQRWQVQHVARLKHELLLRRKVRQQFERRARAQRQILLPAYAPAAPAVRLQQEHVVAVHMRAHAAAVAGVAGHQVVKARIGREAKALQQRVRGLVVQVKALHQQCPAGLAERGQRAPVQGPMAQRPFAGAAALHQARLVISSATASSAAITSSGVTASSTSRAASTAATSPRPKPCNQPSTPVSSVAPSSQTRIAPTASCQKK